MTLRRGQGTISQTSHPFAGRKDGPPSARKDSTSHLAATCYSGIIAPWIFVNRKNRKGLPPAKQTLGPQELAAIETGRDSAAGRHWCVSPGATSDGSEQLYGSLWSLHGSGSYGSSWYWCLCRTGPIRPLDTRDCLSEVHRWLRCGSCCLLCGARVRWCSHPE